MTRRLLLGPVAVIATVVIVTACSTGTPHNRSESRPGASLSPVALGQQIFDTGNDASGQPIDRTGDTSMMGMMSQSGCASCHGTDGHGRSTPQVQAPDITYANLTNPAGMREMDGTRGHIYTDTLIRQAVTQGIGADGDPLSTQMPHWQLTDTQWTALLAYLKTQH
ncbi:MAG: c-type cytochrome [Acidimicrobiales bacterium]